MREVTCPGCGARVTFVSAVSLIAVCVFCHATLMRRDLDVERIGTRAELLEDPSPIQLRRAGSTATRTSPSSAASRSVTTRARRALARLPARMT